MCTHTIICSRLPACTRLSAPDCLHHRTDVCDHLRKIEYTPMTTLSLSQITHKQILDCTITVSRHRFRFLPIALSGHFSRFAPVSSRFLTSFISFSGHTHTITHLHIESPPPSPPSADLSPTNSSQSPPSTRPHSPLPSTLENKSLHATPSHPPIHSPTEPPNHPFQ